MDSWYVCPPSAPAKCSFEGIDYTIQDVGSSFYLNVEGGSVNNGAEVWQWDNPGEASSQWSFEAVSAGVYNIRNKNSGKYLCVEHGGTQNGAKVWEWDNEGYKSFKWVLQPAGNGVYDIMNLNSGKYLNVEGGSNGKGGKVWTWDNPQADSSKWRLQKVTTIEPVGLIAQVRGRIEYESKLASASADPKSKIILAIITMLGLGCCGVDRCYMGSVCLGVIKGLTGGGLVIWGLIDYFVILINCLSMSKDLTSVGFNSTFAPNSVMGGCIICAVVLGIKLIGCVLRGSALKALVSSGRTKVAEETPETSDYATLAA
jgi:hypothetical protein